ncbi:hypothetical protein BC936DRAFT_147668 [Jimgerdemannia flammicorona]|uniref:Uncharacterized protein n=1 Tax=Jimgerdemannia flammicorona TaxID=994334 RepID=A0A433D4V4_9FUNG|nr:hypothetical protein BC936DRAFT_147668 [Jimgerdemannia flammicorona]
MLGQTKKETKNKWWIAVRTFSIEAWPGKLLLVPAARAVRRGNRVVSKVSVVDSDGHDKEQQGMTHKIGDVVSNDTGNSRVEAPYWNGIR